MPRKDWVFVWVYEQRATTIFSQSCATQQSSVEALEVEKSSKTKTARMKWKNQEERFYVCLRRSSDVRRFLATWRRTFGYNLLPFAEIGQARIQFFQLPPTPTHIYMQFWWVLLHRERINHDFGCILTYTSCAFSGRNRIEWFEFRSAVDSWYLSGMLLTNWWRVFREITTMHICISKYLFSWCQTFISVYFAVSSRAAITCCPHRQIITTIALIQNRERKSRRRRPNSHARWMKKSQKC